MSKVKKSTVQRLVREGYSRREIAAVKRGIPQAAVAQVTELRKKLRKDSAFRDDYIQSLKFLRASEASGNWNNTRGYALYNELFREGLGRELIDELVAKSKNKRRSLKILDDGAGLGYFLEEIKRKLREKGIACKTTAVSLSEIGGLSSRKRLGQINEVHKGFSEWFLPKEKQDVIFSVFGGFDYSLRALQRNILLKYAHSLNKGGIICIGFAMHFSITDVDTFKSRVKETFRKRGFEAEFYHRERVPKEQLPSYVLIIRRIK